MLLYGVIHTKLLIANTVTVSISNKQIALLSTIKIDKINFLVKQIELYIMRDKPSLTAISVLKQENLMDHINLAQQLKQ